MSALSRTAVLRNVKGTSKCNEELLAPAISTALLLNPHNPHEVVVKIKLNEIIHVKSSPYVWLDIILVTR